MTKKNRFRTIMMLLALLAALCLAATPLAGMAGAHEPGTQFYGSYPDETENCWPVIRHDPYNSDFSQNAINTKLNYAASNDPAWEKIATRPYPPVKGATPDSDSGGLENTSHFAGSVLDQTVSWNRRDPQGNVVKSGTGALVTTVSKGYAVGVPAGSTGCPHVIAYGADGTLLWTSDEWVDDAGNWTVGPDDPYEPFNTTHPTRPITVESQKLPSSSVVSSSVVLNDRHQVFVADEKYMWMADAATGELLWKWRMPSDDPYDPETYDPETNPYGTGLSTPFVTAFFTANGEVGGVHISGRVTVFPKMDTGMHGVIPGSSGATYLPEAYKTFPEIDQQPAPDMPFGIDLTEILWYPGQLVDNDVNPELWMMDPMVAEKAATGFMGTGSPVANTPATCVDPADPSVTRIFVPIMIDSFLDEGHQDAKLMRVDYTPGPVPGLREPWGSSNENPQGLIPGGNGSATSPDLGESGEGVFIVDQNGSESLLYGFSAEDGSRLWDPVLVGSMYGSATTTWHWDGDADNLIYVQAEGKLIEVDQQTGLGGDKNNPALDLNLSAGSPPAVQGIYKVDTADADDMEDTVLPAINGKYPQAMISGVPVGSYALGTDGQRDYSRLNLTFELALGYRLMQDNAASLWPVKAIVVNAQRHEENGSVTWSWTRLSDVRDTAETSTFPDEDGNIWISHIGTQSSFSAGMRDKYPNVLRVLGFGELLNPNKPWLDCLEPSGGITKLDVITGAPSITGVNPATGKRGYPKTVTVNGSSFAANATVKLAKSGGTYTVNPVASQALTRTEVQARFNLQGAQLGVYNVVVTNPDGQKATLPNAFTVTL